MTKDICILSKNLNTRQIIRRNEEIVYNTGYQGDVDEDVPPTPTPPPPRALPAARPRRRAHPRPDAAPTPDAEPTPGEADHDAQPPEGTD